VTFRLLSPEEAAELDERETAWREALGIPDPTPCSAPVGDPHLLVVDSGVRDDATGLVYFDDAVMVEHTDACGHDGDGGLACLLWHLQQDDGLPFSHADDPDAGRWGTRLIPGRYWVRAWTRQDYWGEWDGGIDLVYPEEAQP
jgi:hypothetical protein